MTKNDLEKLNPSVDDFAALLEESLSKINLEEGKVVTGKVSAIENDFVIVDVGLKTEGRIPVREFKSSAGTNLPSTGDSVDVYLDRVENSNGEAVLSREKAKRQESWNKLEKLHADGVKVEGVIFRGSHLKSNFPKQNLISDLVSSFIQTFSEIHSLNYMEIGLNHFGKPEGYSQRQVQGWIRRYNNAKTNNFKEIEKTIDWLSNNLPSSPKPCLIHNDFKFDNLMFEITKKIKINAVLDWEMSTIGDPLMDLGTSLGYWIHESDPDIIKKMNFNITHIKGMPSRHELVHMYGEVSGRSVKNILFYFVFGLFKIAGIIQQIYFRYKKGLTNDTRFSELNKGVELLGIMSHQAIQKRKIDYLF